METWGREYRGLVEEAEPVRTAQRERQQRGKEERRPRVGSQSRGGWD